MEGLGLKIGSKNLRLLVDPLAHAELVELACLQVLNCLLSRVGAPNPSNIRAHDLVKSRRSIPNRGLVCSKGLGLQLGSKNTGAGGAVGVGADG